MLTLTHASFATVTQLFQYKNRGLKLEAFPGYTTDQWGIKAHNRPWIAEVGGFKQGQRIIEVGGAYSSLPKYLAKTYQLEAWFGDDFGLNSGESIWARWADPHEHKAKNLEVTYSFENFGSFSDSHPSGYFDRVFSVSTLEHIPWDYRLQVFMDMNRCLASGGRQLHTIDIETPTWRRALLQSVADHLPSIGSLISKQSEIQRWMRLLRESGIKIAVDGPDVRTLLNREILVESPDVVFRFYPPNNEVKAYRPSASMLLIIDDI